MTVIHLLIPFLGAGHGCKSKKGLGLRLPGPRWMSRSVGDRSDTYYTSSMGAPGAHATTDARYHDHVNHVSNIVFTRLFVKRKKTKLTPPFGHAAHGMPQVVE